MATDTPSAEPETFEDVIEKLGGIPPSRIRAKPPPGMATEHDVIAEREGPKRRLCELIDGVLVEKPMGAKESLLAVAIAQVLANFVEEHDLGAVLGEAGMLRLFPGLVRIPDVSFIPWVRMPNEEMSDEPIAPYAPDLAVEVLSPSNTRGEIDRKLREYFLAGTRLVWVIQPKTETARVYTSPTDSRRIAKTGSLDGASCCSRIFALPPLLVFPDAIASEAKDLRRNTRRKCHRVHHFLAAAAHPARRRSAGTRPRRPSRPAGEGAQGQGRHRRQTPGDRRDPFSSTPTESCPRPASSSCPC